MLIMAHSEPIYIYFDKMYDASLLPLDTIPDISHLEFHEDFDFRGHFRLYRTFDEPLNLGSEEVDHPRLLALLKIIGQVGIEKCFLSTRTDHAYKNLEDTNIEGVASYWIELRRGLSSCIQWCQYLTSLVYLKNLTGYPNISMNELFMVRQNELKKIRVQRAIPPGQEVCSP